MIKVTEEIKQQIVDRYHKSNSFELADELGISYHTLMKWSVKLKLKKSEEYIRHNSLSKEHEEILRLYYPTSKMSVISKLLNKKPHAIHELARKRKIKRLVTDSRKGNLLPLFSETIESFYWLGFIAADGYVSKNGHLIVSQSEKDKENIENLAKYLETNVYKFNKVSGYGSKKITYRVNICDKKLGPEIYKLFEIPEDQKKTYSEIKLNFIKTEDQALAFLCGFIDGDGSLNNKRYKIQNDESCLNMFKSLQIKLPNINFKIFLEYRKDKNKSFATATINTKSSNYLREFCKKHNIGSTRKLRHF